MDFLDRLYRKLRFFFHFLSEDLVWVYFCHLLVTSGRKKNQSLYPDTAE